MPSLQDLVKSELSAKGSSKETIVLWGQITSWFEAGGPEKVSEELEGQIKEIKSAATKEIKRATEAMPAIKKKRKKRR